MSSLVSLTSMQDQVARELLEKLTMKLLDSLYTREEGASLPSLAWLSLPSSLAPDRVFWARLALHLLLTHRPTTGLDSAVTLQADWAGQESGHLASVSLVITLGDMQNFIP